MYRYRPRRAIRGRGAYYYKPNPAFLNYASTLRGRGGYWGDLWKKVRGYIPRVIGGVGGVLTGDGFEKGYDYGGKVSKLVGWGAYRRAPVRRLRGRGAYVGDAPTVSTGDMIYKGNVPAMHSVGESGIRVYHKELIGVVQSTAGFTVNTYEVNPGINTTFPWLSGIAQNFQQYNVNGLAFVYKPTCSDAISAATISAMGSVSMMTNQDVYSLPPTSTQAMAQSQFSTSGKPSVELKCMVEEDPKSGGRMYRHLLVRTGDIPAGATKQLYDDNVFYIATDGNGVAGVQLGQLFVTYDISFFNPVMLEPGAGNKLCIMTIDDGDLIDSKNSIFGTAATRTTVYDDIGVSVDSTTAYKLNFDIGNAGFVI